MEENVYFLFGGSRDNKRAKRLVKHWESSGKSGMFLVTGYPNDKDGEVESMVSYLINQGVSRESICITSSYETLSNVESCIDVMKNSDNIYASTGPLHWLRFYLIFRLYHPEIRKKITYFPSEEKEVWYAVVVLAVYFVLTPKFWRGITRFMRKEQYNLCQNPENILAIAEKFGVRCLIG